MQQKGKVSKPRKRTQRKRRGKRKVAVPIWVWISALVLLALAILLPYLRPANPEKGSRIPEGNYAYGIDISHHNGREIVWDSLMVLTDASRRTIRSVVKAREIHPVSFVFIKATEGLSWTDREFARNWEEAGRRDFRRGAYHFYRTSKNPVQQARHFINTVGSLRHKDLPPVLDIETLHRGYSRAELNRDLGIWLETVWNHYGRKPVIYTYESFARDYLDKTLLEKYPLWIAHYDVPKPDTERWNWWQFTDKAVVHGIPGHVDLNVSKR